MPRPQRHRRRPAGRGCAVRGAAAARAGRARQREGASRSRAADFRIPARPATDAGDRRHAGQDHHRAPRHATCRASDGEVAADLAQDIVKVAVVARHGKNRNIGRGFVHGFGLKRGAIASSVGHDSHNITVIGVDDADMAVAVNRLIDDAGRLRGGGGRRGARGAGAAGRRADEPGAVRGGARRRCWRCATRRGRSAARCRSRSCRWPSCRCR